MRMNSPTYLIHYGVKGMKWGFTDGQSNGKRKAGDEPTEKEEETEDKWENGLDKEKYYRKQLPDGTYIYGVKMKDDSESKSKGITYGTKETERKRVKRKSEMDVKEEPRKRVKRKSEIEAERKAKEKKEKEERERKQKEASNEKKKEKPKNETSSEKKKKKRRDRGAEFVNRLSDFSPFR